MIEKYNNFSKAQIEQIKTKFRKSIFFLLLCVDTKTKQDFVDVNVNVAFENVLRELSGFNHVLNYPAEIASTIVLLTAAQLEYNSPTFNFKSYRKLILDAGAEILRINER